MRFAQPAFKLKLTDGLFVSTVQSNPLTDFWNNILESSKKIIIIIYFEILYFGLGICQSGVYLLYGIFILHQSKCLYSVKTVETLGPNQKSDTLFIFLKMRWPAMRCLNT